MELVSVHFDTANDFLASYSEANGKPALFYDTRRDDLVPGQALLAEIDFPGLPNHALVRSVVGEVVPNGATLWLSPQDYPALRFAVEFALGNIEVQRTYPRSHARIPAALPIDCRIEGDSPAWVASQTEDLSAGGVFIRSNQSPSIGSRVRLVIGPTPTGERFLIYGKVAWTKAGGFGVRFSTRGHADARRLRSHLRRSAEAGKVAFAI